MASNIHQAYTDAATQTEDPQPDPPKRLYVCGLDGCTFQRAERHLVKEHKRSQHLGTICYWPAPGGSYCSYSTQTHTELREHFSAQHLRINGQRPAMYQCLWPGNIIPFDTPSGGLVRATQPCTNSFSTKSSADRHARHHQHEIFQIEEKAAADAAAAPQGGTQ
ncbi:hypothetical protein F5Y08DRAFT_323864 [Xylaria arbuscula]|nr:hypothetical protein F5Y08DRAFT_323864 [Xylaria arbuscula]